MASLFHILLALAMLAVRLEASGARPTIHFTNAVNGRDPISLTIKFSGFPRGPLQLKPNQDIQIEVKAEEVYFASAVLSSTNKFSSFHAYEPSRDRTHADVYWKADNAGFSISYDKTNWKLVAAWESG